MGDGAGRVVAKELLDGELEPRLADLDPPRAMLLCMKILQIENRSTLKVINL